MGAQRDDSAGGSACKDTPVSTSKRSAEAKRSGQAGGMEEERVQRGVGIEGRRGKEGDEGARERERGFDERA